jgi:TPR repeat protein
MHKAASIMFGVTVAALAAIGTAQGASARQRAVAAGGDGVATVTIVRLAVRGNATYQTDLGYMYETGRGVPQDYRLAAVWYRSAAEQGNVRAQHLLGLLYDRGQGVPIDQVEAHKWLNLAAARAARGDRDYFARIRNAVASKLTRDEIYEAQRRAREWAPIGYR